MAATNLRCTLTAAIFQVAGGSVAPISLTPRAWARNRLAVPNCVSVGIPMKVIGGSALMVIMTSTKYIGMDVHKESISIAVLNFAGKVVMECVIETKIRGRLPC